MANYVYVSFEIAVIQYVVPWLIRRKAWVPISGQASYENMKIFSLSRFLAKTL